MDAVDKGARDGCRHQRIDWWKPSFGMVVKRSLQSYYKLILVNLAEGLGPTTKLVQAYLVDIVGYCVSH